MQISGAQRRPRRVGTECGRRDRVFVATGDIDGEQFRATIGALPFAEEHQYAPVRRPGRPLVVITTRKDAFVAAIRFHDADQEGAARLFGERDIVAAWRPNWCRIAAVPTAQAVGCSACCVHDVELLGAFTIGLEHDLAPIRTVAWRSVDAIGLREAAHLARAQVDLDQADRATLVDAHGQTLAIWREARRECLAGKIADQFALASIEVHDENAGLGAPIGVLEKSDFLRDGIEARRQYQVAAIGEQARVEAVLIHNGQAFQTLVLRSGFVDKDHLGVEITLLQGHFFINTIGDDVTQPAPSLGRCGKTLCVQRLTQNRVVQFDYPKRMIRFYSSSPYSKTDQTSSNERRVKLAFRLGDDSPIIDEVYVNGKKIKAVIDTGGGGTYFALMPEAIALLSLEQEMAQAEPDSRGAGLNGVVTSRKGKIKTLRVGTISVDSPTVIFYPKGVGKDNRKFDGAIGNVFLQDFVVTFDYPNKTVVFEKP